MVECCSTHCVLHNCSRSQSTHETSKHISDLNTPEQFLDALRSFEVPTGMQSRLSTSPIWQHSSAKVQQKSVSRNRTNEIRPVGRLPVTTLRNHSSRGFARLFASDSSSVMAPPLDPVAEKGVAFMMSIGVGKIEEHTGGETCVPT